MLSCKYAEMSTVLIICFTLLSGCAEPPIEQTSYHWIGLNEQSGFEVRSFPKGAKIDSARGNELEQHAKDLVVRGQNRCRQIRLAVIGDTRAAYDDIGVSIYYSAMLAQMEALNPDLLLHVGDLVKNGSRANEWMEYFKALPIRTPLIAVRGNHDRGDYFYNWGIGTSEVFKLDFGPIRLFGLDSEGGAPAVAARLPAFEKLLAESTKRWKIVLLHRPIWSRGLHGSDELKLNHRLIELFDTYGVTLVLSGHDHNYERFCATTGSQVNRVCVSSNKGTNYVVTGGGATMPNPVPTFWRRWTDTQALTLTETSVMFTGDLHFIQLDVGPNHLMYWAHKSHLDDFRSGLSLIDRFEVRREGFQCTEK